MVPVLQQMRNRGRLLAVLTVIAMVVATAPLALAPLVGYLWDLLTP